MNIEEYQHSLGEATLHGWGFLAAYGTLLQGMVALPLALALTAVTPGPARPSLAGMDTLAVLLSAGQVLGLPVVIYLVASRRFALVPLAMVVLVAVHFAPCSWLYATPLYLVMGAAISVAAVLAMAGAEHRRTDVEDPSVRGATGVCLVTGAVMIVCSGAAWLL